MGKRRKAKATARGETTIEGTTYQYWVYERPPGKPWNLIFKWGPGKARRGIGSLKMGTPPTSPLSPNASAKLSGEEPQRTLQLPRAHERRRRSVRDGLERCGGPSRTSPTTSRTTTRVLSTRRSARTRRRSWPPKSGGQRPPLPNVRPRRRRRTSARSAWRTSTMRRRSHAAISSTRPACRSSQRRRRADGRAAAARPCYARSAGRSRTSSKLLNRRNIPNF